MKLFRIFAILLFLAGVIFISWKWLQPKKETTEGVQIYNAEKLERKTLVNMVSATGELSAREIVEVGTQVSGIVEAVMVDFNDTVEAGQLIAKIDQSILDAQVKTADSGLLRANAQLKKAQSDYDRFKVVFESGHISERDFLNYEVALETAKSQVMDAEASVDRAHRNRDYAEIRAPISGIVIHRGVEKGQTVAASFNTPRLFIIAEDLSQMEIIANVDETDIGQIREGLPVRFTVAAYPDDTFEGTVIQLRLQPKVIQNVVNYQVVIETGNPDEKLLPGMTATVDFIVDEVEDVLAVPVAALNLTPTEEMQEVMQKRREQMIARRGDNAGEGVRPGRRPEGEAGMRRSGGASETGPGMMPDGGMGRGLDSNRPQVGMLWYRDSTGSLDVVMVRKGVSDGVSVEVIPLRDPEALQEGMEIITRVNHSSKAAVSQRSQDNRSGSLRRLGF